MLFERIRELIGFALVLSLAAPPTQSEEAKPPSPLRPAFTAADIDWQATAEFPPNPNVKGFAASREDQILRCVGGLAPGASHGGWSPGQVEEGKAGWCRLAFKQPVAIGSILQGASGGDPNRRFPAVEVSILRPEAAAPGDVAKEADWEKLAPLAARAGAPVFVLPPGTKTRAVRIKGSVSAMRYFAGRLADLGPGAMALASAGDAKALQRGRDWSVKAEADVTPDQPQWVMYSWEKPQSLRGVALLQPFLAHYDVAVYTGDPNADPVAAKEADWKRVREADVQAPWRWAYDSLVDFGENVTTTALRIRITRPFVKENSDLEYVTGGKPRTCAIAGLLALSDLGDRPLERPPAAPDADLHPPIPLRFRLKEPGYVTLVIEDADGVRVRNLVSETPFPAGENTAWWDGLDESGRINPTVHGTYEIQGNLVKPGEYRVRGLFRRGIDLVYEFQVYTGDSHPPWHTRDGRGGWLADHAPPSGALFLPGERPQVLLSCFVAEAGDGLVWCDLEGKRIRGVRGIGGGGGWWGADYLARDSGPRPLPNVTAYNGGAWEDYMEIWAMDPNRRILKYTFPSKQSCGMGGLAVRDGLVVASLEKVNQLLLVDAAGGKVYAAAPLEAPRGLAFDPGGRLLAISGKKLVRLALPAPAEGMKLPPAEAVVSEGLEDPHGLALDDKGNIYISDWGASHQVKVFSPGGKPLRAIGAPGPPKVGPYDPAHMASPKGITVASDGRLWVAENSMTPKRVSLWTLEGQFVKAMYGPNWYGGGGAIDPKDRTRFYLHGNGGGLEFKLDWKKGAAELVRLYSLPGQAGIVLSSEWGCYPQTPLYAGGKQYFTNCYACGPTNGEDIACLWIHRDGKAVPVAAVGTANHWDLLKTEPFRPRWPEGVDLKGEYWKNAATFAWSDLNDDAQVQPEEVSMAKGHGGSATVSAGLVIARTTDALCLAPERFTKKGAPVYDVAKARPLCPGATASGTSGGDQVIVARDGWVVLTHSPEPKLTPLRGVAGLKDGRFRWAYPCEYLGLHGGHLAGLPKGPGYLSSITRLLGFTVTPKGTQEELWALNGNQGVVYLMTTDGLFVATLFKDRRQAPAWPPQDKRGMLLNDLSLGEECFFPSINQTADGAIYLVAGQPASNIIRVDGLETIRRLPESTVPVTADQLAAAAEYQVRREAARIRGRGTDTMTVPLRASAPVVDGKLDEWPHAYWVPLDDKASASVAVAGDRLYAAFKTGDAGLLKNTGQIWQQLFKSGGALDLAIGADPKADANREKPAAGDVRLLVAVVQDKPTAVLYRAVVPGTKDPVEFRSWHVITLDRVEDVSPDLRFAAADGNYEFSIPLATLGLAPKEGLVLRGDVGILRGNGVQTIQRVYWHNKAAGIVSDAPSEAMLTPHLWGRWRFLGQP